MAPSLSLALLLATQSYAQVPQYAVAPSYGLAPASYQPPPGYQPIVQQPLAQEPNGYVVLPMQQPPAPQYEQPAELDEGLSREDILTQRDLFAQQSEENVVAALLHVTQEVEAARAAFLNETERSKAEYLGQMEDRANERLQDVDEQAAATTAMVQEVAREYEARLETQARALLLRSAQEDIRRAIAERVARVEKEEFWAKDELENQIRAAYDASRIPGGAFPDPNPVVQQARSRFDTQMKDLALRRGALKNDLQQELQAAEANLVVN